MTKSEYIEKKEKIENQILDLGRKLGSLKSEYIESNRPFKDGEKVRVTNTLSSKEEFAFVYGYRVGLKGELNPKLKRCKKDGTMSKLDLDYDLFLTDIVSPIK